MVRGKAVDHSASTTQTLKEWSIENLLGEQAESNGKDNTADGDTVGNSMNVLLKVTGHGRTLKCRVPSQTLTGLLGEEELVDDGFCGYGLIISAGKVELVWNSNSWKRAIPQCEKNTEGEMIGIAYLTSGLSYMLYISQSFLNAKYIVKPAELIPNVYTEQFRVMGRFMTSSSEYTLCWDSQWRPVPIEFGSPVCIHYTNITNRNNFVNQPYGLSMKYDELS
ncbi:unnamed protein product [Toxocara canis]|uniref:Glycoprotein n=1 Tax=Toxocara canis TaxID=6265 RepID=A0A183V096_TOXCA|nr:unnamed protein product [Toxocara canis]